MDDDVPGGRSESDVTQPIPAPVPEPAPAPAPAPAAPATPGVSWRAMAVPVVAALIVGVGAGWALNDVTRSNGSADGQRGLPVLADGGVGGQGEQGQGAPPQGGFGGVEGEVRIQGTVTATTGSTVTITPSGGTAATYTVDSTTQIVRDGRSATLADVEVGDAVLAHVVPSSSGGNVVERLFVGTLPQSGPGAGAPPGEGQPGSGQSQSQAF